jgi:dTDP-4-amino-4,6-dideoxygalactose transaminase
VEPAELDAGTAVMKSSWLGPGPKVAQLEKDFCAYAGGGSFPAAVNSCTVALHLGMLAAEIKPGAEVIITPRTRAITPGHFAGRACQMDELVRLARNAQRPG